MEATKEIVDSKITSTESSIQSDENILNTEATKETVDNEATSSQSTIQNDESNKNDSEYENICSICLDTIKDSDKGAPDCCAHVFCFDCIKKWSKVSTNFK